MPMKGKVQLRVYMLYAATNFVTALTVINGVIRKAIQRKCMLLFHFSDPLLQQDMTEIFHAYKNMLTS